MGCGGVEVLITKNVNVNVKQAQKKKVVLVIVVIVVVVKTQKKTIWRCRGRKGQRTKDKARREEGLEGASKDDGDGIKDVIFFFHFIHLFICLLSPMRLFSDRQPCFPSVL